MGAVTFSLDRKLIEAVKKVLPLSIFVETGTFKGDTTAACIDYFDQLYTIELSEELYIAARNRFSNEQAVTVFHDDSARRLSQLNAALQNKSVLYWLDAHWCVASDTAGEKSQCPLLHEIIAIGDLNPSSLIIIDDARLFLCSPTAPHEVSQWPQLQQIIEALFNISAKHRITIVNDCIIYYPAQIESQINQYAQSVGVDWLRIMNIYTDKEKLHDLLAEKEFQITLLNQASQQQYQAVLEKEHAIDQLGDALKIRAESLLEKELEINEKDNEIIKLTRYSNNLTVSIHEKEQEINNLTKSANYLTVSNHEKEQEINEKEYEILKVTGIAKNLAGSLQEKEQEILRLNKYINLLNQSLEEKELFIQRQDKFIKQKDFFRFYALKALLKIVAYISIKFKHSIFYGLLIFVKRIIKSSVIKKSVSLNYFIFLQKSKFKKKFGPFLGVLNQYPPKKLILPKSYYKNVAINNPLKISIVTPSYQQSNYIERTLKSVLDQHYPNLEYFVQDGGSKDETTTILQAYTQQLFGWESKSDKGQSHAINLGFAKTTGEIMAWLNSDDVLLPGTLAYVANYFDKHPDVDVIYGDRIIVDENDMEIGRWVMPRNDYAVLSWADYIPQETLFWRRSIWDKAGGEIDQSFQFAMDWDLLVRFRDAGACINRLPRFLGAFRVHTQQKTSAAIEDVGAKEMQIIRTRCNGFEPADQEIHNNLKFYLWGHCLEHNIRLIHYKR